MNVEERVLNIFEEILRPSDGAILVNQTKDELGMDSLDDIETLMMIEEEFDLEISDSDAEKFKTVQSVIDYVSAKLEITK